MNIPPRPTLSRIRNMRSRLPAGAAALVGAGIAAGVVGCGLQPTPSPTGASTRLAVATTSTVFGDLVANVGGDLVQVTSLVPRNVDVHTFAPAPADVQAVAAARVLFMNGLGLDDWLLETIRSAASEETPLVRLGVDLPGVQLLPGEEPGEENPHLWMAIPYAILYVDRIEAALAAADPAHADAYRRQADAYRARLTALDAAVRDKIAAIPAADRKIVTFHDAFPYLAREYGIEVVGVAVGAPGQEPSAGEVAALIDAIRTSGVKAIFSESQFPTELVDRIASETGATVVAELYADSLGEPPVDSYEGLMQWDIDQLVRALT